MTYLTIAVGVVGLLCILTLLLLLGVIRRLREHAHRIDLMESNAAEPPLLAVGSTVGQFSASTVDEALISRDSLGFGALVGFFSTDCEACEAKRPSFIDRAQSLSGGRETALAVVVGEPKPAVVDALRRVAQVVEEPHNGAVAQAFSVHVFPSFFTMEDAGVIATSGVDIAPVDVDESV